MVHVKVCVVNYNVTTRLLFFSFSCEMATIYLNSYFTLFHVDKLTKTRLTSLKLQNGTIVEREK